tara:strand:+ start:309 stop:578 length:270 start_codon:yes stop_codon:yes gene_type:complete
MMTSEEKFLTAILTQAVEDASYEGTSKKYLKHKVAATNWIVSNDPEYQNYCKMLGIDPASIRNKILKNVNMKLSKPQTNKLKGLNESRI